MRTLLLTILLLSAWTLSFTQTSIPKKDSIVKAVVVDTLKAKKTDTVSLSKVQLADRELRVIFEDTSKPEYFKYIFPILTLLLGIGVNKFLDYIKDKKQIKKTGERWKAELASLEMPISKQIEYLEEFLLEHNKEFFGVPKLKVATPLECEIFNSLDKSDFVKFLQTNLSKDFKAAILFSGKVNSFISILKSNNENLRLKFNDYLQGTSNHTTNLTIGLQDLLNEFIEYSIKIEKEVNGDPIHHPTYKLFFTLFENEIEPKMKSGDYDIYQLEENFFVPLFRILGQTRLDDRTKEMGKISRKCISSIKGIKMEKRYLSENISTLISHYKHDAEALNEILNDYK